jgi:hypothetical protein
VSQASVDTRLMNRAPPHAACNGKRHRDRGQQKERERVAVLHVASALTLALDCAASRGSCYVFSFFCCFVFVVSRAHRCVRLVCGLFCVCGVCRAAVIPLLFHRHHPHRRLPSATHSTHSPTHYTHYAHRSLASSPEMVTAAARHAKTRDDLWGTCVLRSHFVGRAICWFVLRVVGCCVVRCWALQRTRRLQSSFTPAPPSPSF